MAKRGQIEWTDKQKEIAQLLTQGKKPKDVIASGYTSSQVYKVHQALKNGERQAKPKAQTIVPTTPPLRPIPNTIPGSRLYDQVSYRHTRGRTTPT